MTYLSNHLMNISDKNAQHATAIYIPYQVAITVLIDNIWPFWRVRMYLILNFSE